MINLERFNQIKKEADSFHATLVAVSKTKPLADILELKKNGQKDFGENYVQELTEKQEQCTDVNWHFIGHLQTNKVKYIAPFVHLIHGVDSESLLKEVNKQGEKSGKVVSCLLQLFIADEETKFGLSFPEAEQLLNSDLKKQFPFVDVCGLMGMATLTEDEHKIRSEFKSLRMFFERFKSANFQTLSMGMTSDYPIALEEGSTMIRIGSAIFGERNYKK